MSGKHYTIYDFPPAPVLQLQHVLPVKVLSSHFSHPFLFRFARSAIQSILPITLRDEEKKEKEKKGSQNAINFSSLHFPLCRAMGPLGRRWVGLLSSARESRPASPPPALLLLPPSSTRERSVHYTESRFPMDISG